MLCVLANASSHRFFDTLTAKVHKKPLSVEELSEMFQDVYAKAEIHISTHIQNLSRSQTLPDSSVSARSIRNGKDPPARIKSLSSRDTLNSINSGPEQQMLTPQEIAERRRTRRLLEHKRIALEEAVERRVCERVYKRIWRHRSTLDEARDEKLRSRIAALALVGINLKDLGVTSSDDAQDLTDLTVHTEDGVEVARAGLLKMNEEQSPVGKLQHLAGCHKAIVDLLTRIHGSSSSASADEVLPALIYTLIRSPPEGTNIISNLQYIQRFRNASKIDGEAAYCLTNLEAAISFLETVDLASLRADELLEGPVKTSNSSTKFNKDILPPANTEGMIGEPEVDSLAVDHPLVSPPDSPEQLNFPRRPTVHVRHSSNLFEPATSAIGAAGDAVKSTADQGLKTVSTALDTSFKFFFGKMKERQSSVDDTCSHETVVPKTLDDARKLVEPKSKDDEGLLSEVSSIVDEHMDSQIDGAGVIPSDSLLNIFGGRQQMRDRSVDSSRSGGSGKRTLATFGTSPLREAIDPTSSPMSATLQAPTSTVDSMRNFGNAINPLNRLGGMNVMKGFGKRNSSGALSPAATLRRDDQAQPAGSNDTISDEKRFILAPPPIARFAKMKSATELKVGELDELLQDYKRLAMALEKLE